MTRLHITPRLRMIADIPAHTHTHMPSWRVKRQLYLYYSMPITYLLHGVLLERLTGLQLVKKSPAFYGILRFITAFTSSRHLFLSCASSIQSMPLIPLPEYPS
jgi:hypothetical protein